MAVRKFHRGACVTLQALSLRSARTVIRPRCRLVMPALARSLSLSRSRSLSRSLSRSCSRCLDDRFSPHGSLRPSLEAIRCNVRSSSSYLASASSSSSSAGSESSSSDEVKIRFGKQNASAPSGTLLRSAMLMNGLSPHNEGARTINCRGLGTW